MCDARLASVRVHGAGCQFRPSRACRLRPARRGAVAATGHAPFPRALIRQNLPTLKTGALGRKM
jgi:hypothetical protein